MSFGSFDGFVDVGIPGGVVVGGKFQVAGIWDDGHEMRQCDAVQRTVVVRGHGDVMDLCVVGNFFHLCEATGPCQVWIKYVGGTLFQDLLKPPAGEDSFAGSDRNTGTFAYLTQG